MRPASADALGTRQAINRNPSATPALVSCSATLGGRRLEWQGARGAASLVKGPDSRNRLEWMPAPRTRDGISPRDQQPQDQQVANADDDVRGFAGNDGVCKRSEERRV